MLRADLDGDLFLQGGGDAVLLLHGLLGSAAELRHLARTLNKAGYTVQVAQIAGYTHGTGSVSRSARWREQALARFDALALRHRSVSVCGLCMGANLALAVAQARGPAVSALVLLSTTLYYDGWNIPWSRMLLPLARYTPLRRWYVFREQRPYGVKNARVQDWIADAMAARGASAAGAANLPLRAIHEAEHLIRAVKRRLDHVVAPTLVVHAVDDDVASVRSARVVAAGVSSDVVKRVFLRDSYHMITLDNEKDKVAAHSLAFLDAHTAGHVQAERGAPAPRGWKGPQALAS